MRTSRRNLSLTLAAAALAIFVVPDLSPRTAQAQEEENTTCGGNEACSDQLASAPRVRLAWEEGISYEVVAEPACTMTMTIVAAPTQEVLATKCLSGDAEPLTVWYYTLQKLAEVQGDVGFVSVAGSTSGGGLPSLSPTSTATTTTLTVSTVSSSSGDPVLLRAFITTVSPGSPAGQVTFFDGAVALGTAPVTPLGTSFVATFITSTLGVGTHLLTASYSGDLFYAPSTSTPVVLQVLTGLK